MTKWKKRTLPIPQQRQLTKAADRMAGSTDPESNGMLSNIQYMQQELAWLQAQSGYKCADLALQQAIQNYKWAVAGASVSADTQ